VYPAHAASEWSNWPAVPEERKELEFKSIATGKTVVDMKTCLMWRRDIEGAFPWAEAKSKCNGSVDGYDTWRLPTRIELLSLVDRKKATSPTINEAVFPGTPPGDFWTSTARASGDLAWRVSFLGSSGTGFASTSYPFYVRCVR
jgi:hypothetical protein